MPLHFDNSYARLPERFYHRLEPSPVAEPQWLATNSELAQLLGLSETELCSEQWLEALAGNGVPAGAEPMALAYAGHQFGGFVPQLGDGRALLLGEVVGSDNRRRDVQLKGSGPTPYSRGGDGRAALGPVLREYLMSEAMHALGIPTTRALAAVLSGEPVFRARPLPGAVLTRVASSHLRVGTFQYFAVRDDHEALVLLVEYALERHYPQHAETDQPALALFEAVMEAQAKLVAKWLAVGFVHGVMNTDNCSIAGETIDYGPCALLDTYDPNRCFSSIDHLGRYAYANQPKIAKWNMARFGETLLRVIDPGDRRAVSKLQARLERFDDLFDSAHLRESRCKLGLCEAHDGDAELFAELLAIMHQAQLDYTLTFRELTRSSASDTAPTKTARQLAELADWTERWQARRQREAASPGQQLSLMQHANPAFIPRNHVVEGVIAAAETGDLEPFERLRGALQRPYTEQPGQAELMAPPGDEQWEYQTFCGT